MTDQKRGGKTKYRLPQSWRRAVAVLLLLTVLISGICTRYFSFVSRTFYQESTSHLSEILHKSDNMLNHLVSRNRMLLHLWSDFLDNASSEEQIRSSLNEMKGETGSAALYFLAADGSCMTPDGETGSLGSQVDLNGPFSAGEDVVLNAALPGKPQMLVFACPETQGTYRGFAYDAVAIAYYNNAVLNALDNTAFGGAAHSYVIYPDGRVVLDSSDDSDDPVYNLLAELREHSDLTEEKFDALSDDLAQGRSGSLMLTLRGTRHYLVYESTGIQNWSMLSLVPVSIVNASMDRLWFRTIEIVTVIMVLLAVLAIALIVRWSRAALSRKDTEILYQDELFNRLSHSVDDVFLMLDGETSHADYISPNIERLLGVPLEQVRQDVHVLKLLHDADSPNRDKNFLEGMQRGEQREWDVDYVHQATGERRWFHIIAMGTETAGRTKYILVLSDRTADREVNQALADAVAAAQSASRAKSDFLTNMSHDIRTPMNAIIGFSELLEKHIDEKDKVLDYTEKIRSSSAFLLSLINYVLEMARIESGKAVLKEETGDLCALMQTLSDVFEPSVQQKKLTCTYHTDVEHPYIVSDRTKVREILLNVISNAIKYTPEGGHIAVSVKELPSEKPKTGRYTFTVQDDGIGMSEEYLPHIFEEFTREHTSTESKVIGTGLGLPIVKALVEWMHGSIDVQSKLGAGTTVTITLGFPLADEAQKSVEEQDAEGDAAQLKGCRILLAEDNDLNAEIVVTILEESGLTVERTADGELCIEALKAHPAGYYDAILMDIQMPNMDGYQATKLIRNLSGNYRTIPIIAMTANAFDEDRQKALSVGMDAHLAKPVDVERLFGTLRKVIR